MLAADGVFMDDLLALLGIHTIAFDKLNMIPFDGFLQVFITPQFNMTGVAEDAGNLIEMGINYLKQDGNSIKITD